MRVAKPSFLCFNKYLEKNIQMKTFSQFVAEARKKINLYHIFAHEKLVIHTLGE